MAALHEKLRLLENNNQVNNTAPEGAEVLLEHTEVPEEDDVAQEHIGEIREETLNHTLSTNEGNLQDSLSSAESGRTHHYTGEDGHELQQNSSDNEAGSVRGKLETSVSARKQHRPFIIYPKLKFKACPFSPSLKWYLPIIRY